MPAELSPYDRQAALQNVGGSEAVLRDIVRLFAEESPKQLAELRHAYTSGDPAGVARAAHLLKGSVALLAAGGATDAARRMEHMGLEGDLSDFEEAWSSLQHELSRLAQALELPPYEHDPKSSADLPEGIDDR